MDKQKCLVLDWDCTVTDIHSGGYPQVGKSYWKSNDNFTKLYYLLRQFSEAGWKIIIVSRADHMALKDYINSNALNMYIYDSYGSTNPNILNPDSILFLDEKVKDVIGLNSMAKSESDWAVIKTKIIEKIMAHFKILRDQIYFIDDTVINIEIALKNDIVNSFVCVNGSVGLCDIMAKLL